MIEKEIQFRKKREFGEIITDSFQFLKQEKRNIIKLVINYVLPFVLLYAIALVYLQKNVITKIDFSDTESLMANIGPVYFNLFLFTLFGLFVQSLLIGAFYSYIEIYEKKGKGNFEFSEVSTLLYSNGLLALGSGLFWFIMVMLGFILCVIPGIYFANALSLVFIIQVFEKKGLRYAAIKSVFLVNKQWWNTFMLNILGLIMIWTVGLIFSIPSILAGLTTNIVEIKESTVAELPQWYWFSVGVSTVISSVLWLIIYTFLAFQYFNLEERFKMIVPPTKNLN